MFTRADNRGEQAWVMSPDGSGVRAVRGFGHSFSDLSADGRQLAWTGNGGLYMGTLTDRRRLSVERIRIMLRTGHPPIWPRWSPNGRFIAAVREVGGSSQVFVIRRSSGRARRLRASVPMKFPSWSPDGRRIVAQGPRGLWVINVATGAAREILSFDTDNVLTPAWSPNGRWIAFDREPRTRGPNDPLAVSQLWLVRPDGSGLRQLTHLTGAEPTGPPSWSPDGRRLACITYTGGSNRPIATIRANGSGLRILTRRGFNYGVDWSR